MATKLPSMTQWFTFEEHEAVEKAVEALKDLKITELRTIFSWADYEREGGPEWFDWFIKTLGQVPNLRLLPNLFYTPYQQSQEDECGNRQTSYPPKNASTFKEFASAMIDRYGAYFDWIELWNEPNWKPYWDDAMDPDWSILVDMLRQAAEVAHQKGKKVALGGTAPLELPWFTRMDEKGLLTHMDAVCFHYAPSWPEQHRRWFPLETEVHGLRALLKGLGHGNIEIWLDEAGVSTEIPSDHDQPKLEQAQIDFFDGVRKLPVDRLYWFCLLDQKPDAPTDDMINTKKEIDITAYHFGLIKNDGAKKPLYDHWKKLAREEEK